MVKIYRSVWFRIFFFFYLVNFITIYVGQLNFLLLIQKLKYSSFRKKKIPIFSAKKSRAKGLGVAAVAQIAA